MRDIMIAELTGAKLHIQHISTAKGLEMVRAAKAKGLPVTCEATPHHMFLTEDAIDGTYNTCFKVNPPLRTAADARGAHRRRHRRHGRHDRHRPCPALRLGEVP